MAGAPACSGAPAAHWCYIGAGSLVGLLVPSACSSHKTRVRNEGLDLTSEITKAPRYPYAVYLFRRQRLLRQAI